MSLKIRLARAGAKKRPFYRIVVADSRMPRDGRYIEKIGTYNPLLPRDSGERVNLEVERAKHWLSHGAQPTDRVLRFLDAAGLMKREARVNPSKGQPGKKRIEREEAKVAAEAEKVKAAAGSRRRPPPKPPPRRRLSPSPPRKSRPPRRKRPPPSRPPNSLGRAGGPRAARRDRRRARPAGRGPHSRLYRGAGRPHALRPARRRGRHAPDRDREPCAPRPRR